MSKEYLKYIDEVAQPEVQKILKEADESAGFNFGIIEKYFSRHVGIDCRLPFHAKSGIRVAPAIFAYERDGHTGCKGTNYRAMWAWDLSSGSDTNGLNINGGIGWQSRVDAGYVANALHFDCNVRVQHQKSGDVVTGEYSSINVCGSKICGEKWQNQRIWYTNNGPFSNWSSSDFDVAVETIRHIEDALRVIQIKARVADLLPGKE